MNAGRERSAGLLPSRSELRPSAACRAAETQDGNLEAGRVVWRSSGLSADVVAGILIKAMFLRHGQVVRLHVERIYTLQTGRVDIVIEAL